MLCDPGAAATLLRDARIDERRAPVTHPEIMPGLALASASADSTLREALEQVCNHSESVSVASAESWEDAGFLAYSYRVTGSNTVGCALAQTTVTVSVGIRGTESPTYALRSVSPVTNTPIGDCDVEASWREETVIDGADDQIRLVLVVDRTHGDVLGSEVVLRSATPDGWREEELLSPAPERYVGGASGPLLTLSATGDGGVWVVAHSDRQVVDGQCTPVHDQTVWRLDDGRWTPTQGREALALLARRGLWRLAGSDGWLHIVVQDDEGDEDVLAYRATRLGRRYPEPLRAYSSSDLPGLNAGFTVMAPAPFETFEQAKLAKRGWRSMHRHYVKRAWVYADPCLNF